MTDTPKPPMVVWLKPSTAARDDDSGTFWPGPTGATLAYMQPKDKSEAYVHIDQFLAEVERRAKAMVEKDAEENHMYLPAPVDDLKSFWIDEAMLELAKEIKEWEMRNKCIFFLLPIGLLVFIGSYWLSFHYQNEILILTLLGGFAFTLLGSFPWIDEIDKWRDKGNK